MQHPTDRIAHTTAFVTPVVEHWPDQCTVTLFQDRRVEEPPAACELLRV